MNYTIIRNLIISNVFGLCVSFAAFPASAADLTQRQVKRIARQELNQAITARRQELRGDPGATGTTGPAGPRGAQGISGALPFLYARISAEGDVDESRSDGILDSDVRRLDVVYNGPPNAPREISYCFTIPATGAQVTADGESSPKGAAAQVKFPRFVEDGCNFLVFIFQEDTTVPGGFLITVY